MSAAAVARLSPRRTKLALAAAVLVALVVYCIVDPPWTVKSLDSQGGTSAVAGSSNLDPEKYVSSIWSSKLLPTVKKSAVELTTLLPALEKNRAGTIKRYGNFASTGGFPAFLVKGSGRVVSVDTAALVSTAGIALDPGSGSKPDVFIQLGPILTGTDVRDALPFINFNQFLNQVQYEEVSIAINSRIRDSVAPKLDPATLKGKKVAFSGAFTLGAEKNVVVMPVLVDVTG